MTLTDFGGLATDGAHAPLRCRPPGRPTFETRPGVTSVHGVPRWPGRLAVLTGLLVLPAAGVTAAVDATADTRPNSRTTPAPAPAAPPPTVQIDGVVWSQAIVGTTVYAGGKFTTARPAGAAPGTRTVKRGNLLAYDIRTGVLRTTLRPRSTGRCSPSSPPRTASVSTSAASSRPRTASGATG